jgi:hypothetical protein
LDVFHSIKRRERPLVFREGHSRIVAQKVDFTLLHEQVDPYDLINAMASEADVFS